MKFRVNMKSPDVLHDAIYAAVAREAGSLDGLSEEEQEVVAEVRKDAAIKLAQRWFRWGEYLEVEIDTEAETIKVIEQ